MADARGWEPFLLGGLPLLDGRARGSDPWKLEATILMVEGQVRALKVDFYSLVVLPLGDDHLLHRCHRISSQRLHWYSQSYATYVASFSWST